MNPLDQLGLSLTRRHFFAAGSNAVGWAAMSSLMASLSARQGRAEDKPAAPGGSKTGHAAALPETHFPAKAKNVIYLHMVGGPPQMDLYDYKPQMEKWYDKDLPGEHAGVSFRTAGDPILYINNPPGVSPEVRRRTLDGLRQLNEMNHAAIGDPETVTRIQQYEMAFRMQASVPELTDLKAEPESTFGLYGEAARKPGTLPNTLLLARRLVERGVRFVQIYHNNWDTHSNVSGRLPDQCRDVDQATSGLINDLKARGLLDSTLIIWGGEFGRTIYSQGGLSKTNYGRDHHPRCFTMWMAGGGAKGGTIYGETDDFSYNIVKDPVHIRDFHATVLHLLGIDHERFTVRHLGLDQKLTGVEPARVIRELLA
jgi:hypothetical protein